MIEYFTPVLLGWLESDEERKLVPNAIKIFLLMVIVLLIVNFAGIYELSFLGLSGVWASIPIGIFDALLYVITFYIKRHI